MRRFNVWLNKNVVGEEVITQIVTMPDYATDEECDEVCAECVNTMIDNELYTGWEEIE